MILVLGRFNNERTALYVKAQASETTTVDDFEERLQIIFSSELFGYTDAWTYSPRFYFVLHTLILDV